MENETNCDTAMLRLLGSNIIKPVIRLPVHTVGVRYNSSFDQLNNAIKSREGDKTKNLNTVNDINDLLNSSLELPENSYLNNKSNEYGLGNLAPNPRDVAKSIPMFGPIAGRTVDVHYGGLDKAVKNVGRVVLSNRLAYYKKVQKRFIAPAKHAKQKKRDWWRRKFSEGFKDLMTQVEDARRRGY